MTSITEIRRESIRTMHEQVTGGTVEEFAVDLLSITIPTLSCWVKNNIGRESTDRIVAGRDKAEDIEIKIDGLSEKFIVKVINNKLAKKHGLSFSVLSEHNNSEVVNEGKPHVSIVLDPFENSDEYKRRLPTPPFSHFQIYNHGHEPIAAGAGNLTTGEMYFSAHGNNYCFSPESKFKKLVVIPKPREVKSVKDGNVAIASYDGKYKYSSLFDEYFTELKKDLEKSGGSFHGKGGSHSYIDLTNGAISAYIMFNEPRGETDPAYLFALQAGCRIVSVDLETGEYKDYKFDPSLQHKRTPFLIAARSTELIEEIIRYYMQVRNSRSQTI